MKRSFFVVAVLILSVSLFLTVGAERAEAQGPAGAGASTAAKGSSSSHSSHSLNPIKWVQKDKGSKNSPDSNATDACAPFVALNECLAALHASHNLGLDFKCLSASVTGVHSNADMSGCKVADGEKALSLNKAIRALNPNADAKGATKNAEQQAKDDLKDLGA